MSPDSPGIIITGGHLSPAIATIRELQRHDLELIFVGRPYLDTHASPSTEEQAASALGIPYESLDPPKFHRKPLVKNISELPKAVSSFIVSNRIISAYQPRCLLSFGGYLALPMAYASRLHSVPIITHEQTTTLGLTNRLIKPLARHLALSWPPLDKLDQISSPSSPRTSYTGNPVRQEFLTRQPRPHWLKHSTGSKPLLLVTGGSQGSQAINSVIFDLLPSLTKHLTLVHQTGSTRNSQDYHRATRAKAQLSTTQQTHYYPLARLSTSEMAWCVASAALVIGRSGANTVTELLVSSTHCLLIPLPASAGGEQHKNALLMEQLGLAYLLPQTLIATMTLDLILTLANQAPYQPSPEARRLIDLHTHAAHNLATLTAKCVKTPR